MKRNRLLKKIIIPISCVSILLNQHSAFAKIPDIVTQPSSQSPEPEIQQNNEENLNQNNQTPISSISNNLGNNDNISQENITENTLSNVTANPEVAENQESSTESPVRSTNESKENVESPTPNQQPANSKYEEKVYDSGIKLRYKRGCINGLPRNLTDNPQNVTMQIFLRAFLEIEGKGSNNTIINLAKGFVAGSRYCNLKISNAHILIGNALQISDGAKVTFENCTLEPLDSNAENSVLLHCLAEGNLELKNCVIRNGIVVGENAGGGLSSINQSPSIIRCDNCSFISTKAKANLVLNKYFSGVCTNCSFSNIFSNFSVLVYQQSSLLLNNCNFNNVKSKCYCNSQSKIKANRCTLSSIGLDQISGEFENCNFNTMSVNHCQNLKLSKSNFASDNSITNLHCKNSSIECVDCNFVNQSKSFPIFISGSQLKGKNIKIESKHNNFAAVKGSDVFLINSNFSKASNTIALDSKVSHTAETSFDCIGNMGIEFIIGSDEINHTLKSKKKALNLDNLNYSSNAIDLAENQIVLSGLNDFSSLPLFIAPIRSYRNNSVTKSRIDEISEYKSYLMNSARSKHRSFIIDRFGKSFTTSVYLDDIDPKMLKFNPLFSDNTNHHSAKWPKKKQLLNISANPEETCPICLDAEEDFDVVIIPCGHKAHASCLKGLFSNECPVCRGTIQSWVSIYPSEFAK